MNEHEHGRAIPPTLAILDWGIGGMGFYRIFKKNYPNAGVCYFSDSGSVPYGKQQKGELSKRVSHVAEFLRNRGVTHLVVACNAASTVLPWSALGQVPDFHVTGVIRSALETALVSEGEKVGVVGGRRTILSGAYSRFLRTSFRKVTQRVAQPLSALIEKGEKDSPLFKEVLAKIVEPLQDADILILACTHYEAAMDEFQGLAPHARIINPARETFQRVVTNWSLSNNSATDVFYTTGSPGQMRNSTWQAFGVVIGEIISLPPELPEGGILPCPE